MSPIWHTSFCTSKYCPFTIGDWSFDEIVKRLHLESFYRQPFKFCISYSKHTILLHEYMHTPWKTCMCKSQSVTFSRYSLQLFTLHFDLRWQRYIQQPSLCYWATLSVILAATTADSCLSPATEQLAPADKINSTSLQRHIPLLCSFHLNGDPNCREWW